MQIEELKPPSKEVSLSFALDKLVDKQNEVIRYLNKQEKPKMNRVHCKGVGDNDGFYELEVSSDVEEVVKEIKVEYPEIHRVLKKLYKHAYQSGIAHGSNQGDGYDFSTAYKEIEDTLTQFKEQQYERGVRACEQLATRINNKEKELEAIKNLIKQK